ncbi:MAG TPA: 5-dehydro-4-deoxy-D-glucuronate isomerase [Bacteroidales bacterium]|jgi:4-deoxy-L-threo-5-hexosulose-uronate ketol-isomerase|nr:5-dehydro-4-deoxy-D-glucuronate isomerase [Bacteroidales bacterium]
MKTNAEIRFAAHPHDVKHWDSERLRKEHLIQDLFVENKVKMVYSLYDRMISGGAMPAGESLKLESIDEIKAPYFLHRREIGIYNVGGKGTVKVDDSTYTLEFKEALYIGSGDRKVIFESDDKSHPALFYFCSTPAHRNFPDKKITKSEAISVELGSLEASNHRVINKMIVNEVLETCQLQMGMTELKPGSVWNTMPPHTHTRRMEVYFYFEVPDGDTVCHFMGEPTETRVIWMKNNEAVLSPQWSIHAAAATSNYTFIWGMGGENLDYGDQDFLKPSDLR